MRYRSPASPQLSHQRATGPATPLSAPGPLAVARRRVGELDAEPLPVVSFDADPRLVRFAATMSAYTNTTELAPGGGALVIGAADADEVADTSRLLQEVVEQERELVHGPLERSRQQWIGVTRPTRELGAEAPSSTQFVSARDAPGPSGRSVNPFGFGLFTSTRTRSGHTAWRSYLDLHRTSALYPLPWRIAELDVSPEARVVEITGARAWVDLLDRYPAIGAGGLVYPDWPRIARDVDGVHMSMRAIVASQGFNFRCACGLTAAGYWDVESTLWLNWCFTGTRHAGMVS
jgi:hypothetical protein